MKIGLLVNPLAGSGGPLGLKGSDGIGAAGDSAALAARLTVMFDALGPVAGAAEWFSVAGDMGQRWLARAGIDAVRLLPGRWPSSAEDSRASAAALARAGVDLLLFAGGDGTARDVLDGLARVGMAGSQPVLGLPAGVKMQSAVFASSPTGAGRVLRQIVEAGSFRCQAAEVMDLDEEALRAGLVAPSLHGYLQVPQDRRLAHGGKTRLVAGDAAQRASIADAFAADMDPAAIYAVCAGSTTFALKTALGASATLLGVDAIAGDGRLLLRDASRAQLEQLAATSGAPWHVVVSPIGGQGYVLGRGSQPLSPALLRHAGREYLHVLASGTKLASLHGRPMLLDSGDAALDRAWAGHVHVVSGRRDRVIWPLAAA